MNAEKQLAQYITDVEYKDLPDKVVRSIKNIILNIAGTTVAGSNREGCQAIVDMVKKWGGAEEATILVHGGKVPAHNAAFANAYMARALDIDDAMFPGMHVGASTVSAALAAGEKEGGCSGKDLITALAVGHEVASRFNNVTEYVGFDHTGVCTVMGTATVAARIMKLNGQQTLDTLGHAFNRSGGSFQSNVDGALSVRIIQGGAAQGGIVSAELGREGLNGPKNFIEGVYGYLHLYGRDKYPVEDISSISSGSYQFQDNLLFKKYPSCACTEGGTDVILSIVNESGLKDSDIEKIEIFVSPIAFRLVGHPFEAGDTPTVNAQFSVRYCVASALLRRGARLQFFEEDMVKDPRIAEILNKITVVEDKSLEGNMDLHLKACLAVTAKDGKVYRKELDQPPGAPKNPLTDREFQDCFRDYVGYGNNALSPEKVEKIISFIDRLEEIEDVRKLVSFLTA